MSASSSTPLLSGGKGSAASAGGISGATTSTAQRLRHFSALVLFKALATLRTERQRTYLGFLWWFFEPLFLMLVFYVVFGMLLDRGGPDFVSILLCGLVLWQGFGNSIRHCTTSIREAGAVLRSVRVSVGVFPLATFVVDSVKSFLVLLVLMLMLTPLGYLPNDAWLMLPVVLGVQLILTCGACLVVAAIVPLLPDLRFVINPLLQGLFFVSAVFYTFDSVPPDMRHWLEWNPVAVLIDCARNILLRAEWPDPLRLLRILPIALLLVGVGTLLLRRFAASYPKLSE